MATKINDLSAASAVTDAMQFETDTGGTTAEKVTALQIKNYVGAGAVVDVQSVIETAAYSYTSVAAGASATTSLTISHPCATTSNEVLILVFLGATASNSGLASVGAALTADGTRISVGATLGSRVSTSASARTTGAATTTTHFPLSFAAKHAPASTSSITYTVLLDNILGSTATLYLNRAESDADNTNSPRTASSLILIEYTP